MCVFRGIATGWAKHAHSREGTQWTADYLGPQTFCAIPLTIPPSWISMIEETATMQCSDSAIWPLGLPAISDTIFHLQLFPLVRGGDEGGRGVWLIWQQTEAGRRGCLIAVNYSEEFQGFLLLLSLSTPLFFSLHQPSVVLNRTMTKNLREGRITKPLFLQDATTGKGMRPHPVTDVLDLHGEDSD